MRWIFTICFTLSCLFGFVSSGSAEMSQTEVKELALEAILENPEIIRQAITLLQQRDEASSAAQAKAQLSEQRTLLERDPNAPVIGNLKGDVTVIEFFDYNCPYCKRAWAELNTVMAQDPGIRVVLREWPILGEASVYAARASLAARKQGKYVLFHNALMSSKGRAQPATVMAIANSAGLDTAQLEVDMKSPEIDEHIETSMQLARALGFSGTPAYIIGDALAPGMVAADELQNMIAQARAAK
ncbi:MAG: DsbA family protein [Paracoccaceae bacterium]|nr:DsbA family protein [Paracoccaceae bacterium]